MINVRTLTASLLLMLLAPASALAQAGTNPLSADTCINEINGRLAQEQRIYRSVLFGLKPAAEEPIGKTRHTVDGWAFIKTGENKWVTDRQPGLQWSDSLMDEQTEGILYNGPEGETKARKGIFETRGALTSELIPSLTQSYRALGCRTAIVCQTVNMSLSEEDLDEATLFTVSIPGCGPIENVEPLRSCQFRTTGQNGSVTTDFNRDTTVRTYCDSMSIKMMDRERELLKTVVAYDAAYRSLLQFAGNFDAFLEEFRTSLMTHIRQAVSLLGQLSRIPCFLSQCNE